MASDAAAASGRPASPGARLRSLLNAAPTVVAPGAFSPMAARLVEQAGFPAVYVPGGGVAMNRLGVADLGLVSMTEMVESAAAIVQSVGVPVIADADTGFGNALNVQRTVREYERAGVAAIHLEDQDFPKRCGHMAGKQLIPLEEAALKIRAAVEARRDPDFMVIARCDALSVTGIDDTVARCQAYLQAGADMLFVESLRTVEEISQMPKLLPAMHVFNMTASGKTPALSDQEVQGLGYRLMILPNFTTLAAIKAVGDVLAEIKRTGSVAGVLNQCAGFDEFIALGGLAAFQDAERRYAPEGSTKP